MSSDERRRRGLSALALVAAIGFVSAPAGWFLTDQLERDNDFCNSCHLAPDLPLHRDIRRNFDAIPPATLSAAHALAGPADSTEAVRCIDCHGGVGFVGRARVKLLSAKDTFWYVMGRFDEPESMQWPLWDEDCTQCHGGFDTREAAEWESPRFHQLPVHNVDLGVDCVECHVVHEVEVDPPSHFLKMGVVRKQCARCHMEFEGDEE